MAVHLPHRHNRRFSHRRLAVHHRGWNLKDELNKLVSGSQEIINMTFYSNIVVHDEAKGVGAVKQRITYEELQRFIEQVLSETGYYSCQPATDDESAAALSDLVDGEQAVAPPERGGADLRCGSGSPLGLPPPDPLGRTRMAQHHLPPMQRPIPVCNGTT